MFMLFAAYVTLIATVRLPKPHRCIYNRHSKLWMPKSLWCSHSCISLAQQFQDTKYKLEITLYKSSVKTIRENLDILWIVRKGLKCICCSQPARSHQTTQFATVRELHTSKEPAGLCNYSLTIMTICIIRCIYIPPFICEGSHVIKHIQTQACVGMSAKSGTGL